MGHDTFNRRAVLATAAASIAGVTATPALSQARNTAGLSLRQAGDALRSGRASPVDLTRSCLAQIEKRNPAINAFITITGEAALASARAMEAEQRAGKWRGPLHGVPIALKDNIDTAGVRTTAASQLFKDRIPTEDAEVVRRLKAAGAVILGKLNLHEFAYGGTSDVSHFGPVHNPWALDHVTGGSSGGSAAAVAADLCFGALGTDTAGSVRIPSSYCGVVGFKPTYGRVSIRGIIPLSWNLDHCGPIARTVEDCALMLQAIAGYDALDPTTVDVPVPDYARAFGVDVRRLRLGVPRKPFFDNLDPEVAQAVEAAVGVLKTLTASLSEPVLPPPPPIFPVMIAEAYAYHAKWIAQSPQMYQPLTRERILGAASQPAQSYVDTLRAIQVARRAIAGMFSEVDLLVTPTMPLPAQTLAKSSTFDEVGLQNTSPFDALGLPTISLPCGFTRAGLPIGLQISGAPWAEAKVLALAKVYEQDTQWHTRRPSPPPK
jgi:aspartyl-tRNA(Asn)/glutamyl-tRNA(Gln) amidotransferase subunit A